jgi:hypothetical protein
MRFAYAFFRDALVRMIKAPRAPSYMEIGHMPHETPLSNLERERIASLTEAAQLRGVSEDSLKRNDRDKILQLGPRRLGMRVKHALMLDD